MLCRACGNEMNASEYCADCNEAILWKCSACEKENDRSIHTHYTQSHSKAASVVGMLIGVLTGFHITVPA